MALFKKGSIESFIKAGKLEKIKKQMTPPHYNDPDAEGHAPLYYAIKYEKSKIARYLLEQGSTPASGSSSPDTPVMEDIVRTFNKNLLTLFLEFGENLPDRIEKLPLLHYAVTHKYFYKDLLKILTDTGVDIDQIDIHKTEKTALAYLLAQEDFSLNAFTALLEAGADVNYALSNEFRPLHVALTNRSLPCKAKIGNFSFETVLDALVRYGLESNFRIKILTGSTVSLAKIALQNKRIEGFILLLEKGMDVEADDLSQIEGHLDVNKFSIPQRKRLVAVNKERNLNLPLHISFYGDELGSVLEEIPEGDTRQLSSKLTDLVMTTHRSLSHKIPLFEELLKKGADINAEEEYAGFKMNVLTALTSWNDGINDLDKLIEWLLDHGAQIECHGRSAFLWAIWFNKPKLVRLYAEKGADLLYKESDGSTMFSKIITNSPSHCQFGTAEDVREMMNLLQSLCVHRGVPFPLDEPFLYGNDADRLIASDILPFVIFSSYKGEIRKKLLDIIFSCGWDINRKFKGYDPNGSILTQLLLINNIEEETIVHLLDNYPEMDLTTPGTDDPLRWAIFRGFSPNTIKRFIDKAENINRQFVRNIDGDVTKRITCSYMELVLDKGPDLEVEAETWAYELGKALLEAGHNPNSIVRFELASQYEEGGRYRKERTLLESTVHMEDVNYFETFKLLLDYGADPYQSMCYFEESFIHYLTQRAADSLSDENRIQYMEELDQRNLLQLESKNSNGGTALLYAASKCRTAMTRYLVEKGADVNAVGGFDQSFAMHRAISNWNWVSKEDRLETVQILLDNGANIEQIDNDGYSPLMAAAAFGCYTVAEELLKRGANPNSANQEDMTAVHFAVKEPYSYDSYSDDSDKANARDEKLKRNIVKLLAEYGADLNLSHKRGGTPMIDAIGYDNIGMLKELIKLGADVTQPDCYGRTPLMVTAKYAPFGYINILGMKRELENSFDHQDDNGENVLHYLASRIYQDPNGSSSSRDRNTCSFTQMLTERSAIPYRKNHNGQTPLHYAAINGMSDMAGYLLGKETDINETDNNGSSALIYALSFDEETVSIKQTMATVELLIENGADVNVKNGDGQTAMGISLERELDTIAERLKKAGAKDQTGIGFV